ncbi:MAG: CHAT domain-containing protein [Saprospiraceae bacterium]
MDKYLLFLVFYLSLVLNQNIRAQEVVKTNEDSLSIFLEKKDLISYFRKITELSDTAVFRSDNNYLLSLSELLQQDFGELNISQRKKLRWTATILGQKIMKQTGNLDETLKIYILAHDNVENKITLDSIAWFIENQISNFYTRKGDYERAEYYANLLEASLKYYGLTEYLSRYYTNLGTKLQSEFKITLAIDVFKRGYAIADSIGYDNGLFANALNLASLYNDYPDLGSPGSYLLKANQLLPSLTSNGRYLEKKSGLEFENAKFKSLQGKYAESILLFNEAIQTLKQYYPGTGRREFAKYYTALAAAYLHVDSIEMAVHTIDLGISSLIPEFKGDDQLPSSYLLYPENSFIDLLELKAKFFEKQFSQSTDTSLLEKAIVSIELALHVNDLIRESILADPSKLVSIRSNKELIEKGISDLYQLFIAHESNIYFERARNLFNRSKALLYSEKTRRNILADIISPADREIWIVLQNNLMDLYAKKFNEQADINALNGEILSCQEKMDKLLGGYADVMLKTQMPLDYIEYFITEDQIYAISELNQQRKFIKLGRKNDFQKLADRLNDFILSKGFSMDDKVLNDVYRFLIRPMTEQLPEHTVIIPDGVIGYVPFEMLKYDSGKYLLENSTISYAFEYNTYLKETIEEDKEWAIFCLAPQYKIKEPEENEKSRGGLYYLPYARMEVDSIRHLYSGDVMSSQSDDKQVWQNYVGKSRIFHYAGHAIIKGDHSYLALNDTQIESQQLTAKEIGLMHNPLELVVLSACETGLGKLEPGEGIRSLGRSFMESGAKATVISLWNVNDKSTAIIMTGFYKYLKEGMRKDVALRQSKLDYLNTASLRSLHPYYWAAFIPAGDMRALEQIK